MVGWIENNARETKQLSTSRSPMRDNDIMSCEEENIDSKPLVDQLPRRHTGITPALCVEEGEIPPTMAKFTVATTPWPSTGPTPRDTKVKADSTEFNGTYAITLTCEIQPF